MEKWRIIIVLCLGSLHNTVFSSPPSPVDVLFSSVNLRNVLQWHPGNDTPPNTLYTVQYAIYGDTVEGSKGRRVHWRVMQQCRDTGRSWCDLTNETWDLEQGYYARVRAVDNSGSSKWTMTTRFEPKPDTTFGPPLVSVVMEKNSANISMNGPMRYQPNNHTPEVSLATLYPQMTYNLSVYNSRLNQTSYFPVASSQYNYRLMEYDTEYCFSAKTRFLSMPVTCLPSTWHCVRTPQDPDIVQLQLVVVGITVPSLCLCMLMVAGYLLYCSLRGKEQKRPHTLEVTPLHLPPLTFSPEKLNLAVITVNGNIQLPVTNTGLSGSTSPQPQKPIPVLPDLLRYTLQRPIISPELGALWENDFPEMEEVDYGFVGVAHNVVEEGEQGEREGSGEGRGEERQEPEGEEVHFDCREQREDGATERYKRAERGGVSDHSATVYTSQANSLLTQKCAPTQMPTHRSTCPLTHTLTETRTLVQAQTSPLVHTFTQTSRSLLQEGTGAELARGERKGEEDRLFSGIFLNKEPHTGLFHILSRPQTRREGATEGGMERGMDGNVKRGTDEVTDGGLEKGTEREKAPLLSPYTAQHSEDTPTSNAGQWDYSSNDYGVLRWATEQETVEEDEGTNCVDWDPETRRLVLPEIETEGNIKEGLDGWIQGDRARERGMRLESVFVRQVSEEEGETERGVEGGWEADRLLTNWNLMIHMDQ
ncbi:interleukin-20 receptor subunit alpha [Polymixia lowei]